MKEARLPQLRLTIVHYLIMIVILTDLIPLKCKLLVRHSLELCMVWNRTFTYTTMVQKQQQIVFLISLLMDKIKRNTVVVLININPVNDCPQNTTFRNTVINEDGGGLLPIATLDTTDPDNSIH